MESEDSRTREFQSMWHSYLNCLHKVSDILLSRPPKMFFRGYQKFAQEVFETLHGDEFVSMMSMAWTKYSQIEENGPVVRLLQFEMISFMNGCAETMSRWEVPSPDQPAETKRWFSRSRKATAKDIGRAGKTLSESILDALGDLLPAPIRGVLKTLKEVLDVAIG